MTFLKYIGFALTVLGDITGVLPAVRAFVGGINPQAGNALNVADKVITKIVAVVQHVEVVFASFTSTAAKSGAQKLQAATPGVQAILQDYIQSGALGSKKISNPSLFLKASAEIAGGFADLLNSLEAPEGTPTESQVQAGQAQLRSVAAAVTGSVGSGVTGS